MTDPDSDAQPQPGAPAVSPAVAVPVTDATAESRADGAAVELREADDMTWRRVDASVTTSVLRSTELAPAAAESSFPPAAVNAEHVVSAEHAATAVTEPGTGTRRDAADADDVAAGTVDAALVDEDPMIDDAAPASAVPLEDLPETVQLDLLDIEPTGDPRVDAALERVRDLAGLPVADHPDVYEDVHRRLQSALADLGPDR